MSFDSILALGVIFMAIITALILLMKARKAARKLPEGWRHSFTVKNFQQSLVALISYLTINLCCETIAFYLAEHHIYNGYVMSINATVNSAFLLGFFFAYTRTTWKRVTYILLYAILPAYCLWQGYYHPSAVLSGNFTLVFYSVIFLIGLIHLTELFLNLDTDLFWFQLKVNLSIMIYSLIAATVSSFTFHEASYNLPHSLQIFYIHYANVILYYVVLTLIFLIEIKKLRRV